jgi:CheY-like chemotaxis protein
MFPAQILIIEDNPDIAHLLRLYFENKGYQINLAGTGEAALKEAAHLIPHLIILDIILPDIDGYEICRRLRTQPRTSHVPIIFLTQKDEQSDKLQGLQLGADDYITKPFDLEELGWRVQNAISRSEREQYTAGLTGLPAGRMIEKQLESLSPNTQWGVMDIRIEGLADYEEIAGIGRANHIIRETGKILVEVLEKHGRPGDFIGHASKGNFILITHSSQTGKLTEYIRQMLGDAINPHANLAVSIGYAFQDSDTYGSISGIIQKANENRKIITEK